jgi:hypothetical protein
MGKGVRGIASVQARAALLYFTVFARVLILFVILSLSVPIVPTMVITMRAAAIAYSDNSKPVSSFTKLLIIAFSPLLKERMVGGCAKAYDDCLAPTFISFAGLP